ncbi:predicted protein [Sclerotinia sclerotiorum 1980 UF-70]|uniref:Uncharacterized protein n=1 Tax=Sclerotinia sclerotiorum (strain ATCC 18683 / 1980 / Ss-1) TaxID=665079 RepID=A7ESU7_SCLS1|nr:predicted protein [Sclerotinia sclerotiorum 1980 UF-70]EDN92539.1 predicted protein [Sclerotinia sclerotiorum 1980 UF-70]
MSTSKFSDEFVFVISTERLFTGSDAAHSGMEEGRGLSETQFYTKSHLFQKLLQIR